MRSLVVMLALVVGSCGAQEAIKKPIDVPSVGVVYLLDGQTNSLKTLPDEAFKGGHSSILKSAYSKAAMVGSLDVSGLRSPFRVPTGRPEFVFNYSSPEQAKLFVSKSGKNERRFESVSIAKDNSMTRLPGIAFDLTEYGDSSYKLIPTNPLPPGEYAIVLAGSPQSKDKKLFTFGVD